MSCYFKVSWNNKINKIILYSNYNMNSNNSMLIVQYPMQFSIWMDSWISKITTVLMMERGEYLTKTIFKQYGSIYYTKFAYVYIYICICVCVVCLCIYCIIETQCTGYVYFQCDYAVGPKGYNDQIV